MDAQNKVQQLMTFLKDSWWLNPLVLTSILRDTHKNIFLVTKSSFQFIIDVNFGSFDELLEPDHLRTTPHYS